MANIKLLRTCMVGRDVQKKGWIGPADDDEAKALITANYAAEHKGPIPAAEKPAKGDDKPPVNKLAAILEGTVPEVTASLEGLTVDELDALDKLEVEGKDRAGVHDAIATAVAAAE